MKKILLCAAFAASAFCIKAENKAYFFADEYGDQMGTVYSISPDGELAVIFDDEMFQSFLWRRSDPTKLELLNEVYEGQNAEGEPTLKTRDTDIRCINNDGTMVGSVRSGNAWLPFVWKLGEEKVMLPLPEWALNQNFPCGMSADAKIIGGRIGGRIEFEDGTTTGQGRPAFWVMGSDGEYQVYAAGYDDLQLPEHDGVNVTGMYTDGTLNNSYIYGSVGCGVGSRIPFIYDGTGEFKIWNELTYADVPWTYKGQVMGYVHFELIDGKRDYTKSSDDFIWCGFNSHDAAGNIYGSRAEVYDLEETENVEADNFGFSKHRYHRGYYNVNTKEWNTVTGISEITTGVGGKIFFTSNMKVYPDGLESDAQSVSSFTGCTFNGKNMRGVSTASETGRTLGALYATMDDMGAEHGHPVMIVMDKDLVEAGVDNIYADANSQQVVLVYGGTIEVIGAENVNVYDLNGTLVVAGNCANVGSGIYVVVADGVSHKIMVK